MFASSTLSVSYLPSVQPSPEPPGTVGCCVVRSREPRLPHCVTVDLLLSVAEDQSCFLQRGMILISSKTAR